MKWLLACRYSYERLNAIERFIFVAEHGVGAALGTLQILSDSNWQNRHLFLRLFGGCHCAESQCQKEENGFLKHIVFMLKLL